MSTLNHRFAKKGPLSGDNFLIAYRLYSPTQVPYTLLYVTRHLVSGIHFTTFLVTGNIEKPVPSC
jgi:hypothetical protein